MTDNPTRIAINGFGRIGRSLMRVLLERSDLEVVHINDPMPLEQAAYLFKHDSVMGRLSQSVESQGDSLVVAGKTVSRSAERNASKLNWRELGVDLVVNSSGANNDRATLEAHLEHGAKRVVVTAPAPGIVDRHVMVGVNGGDLQASDRIISGGSCTAHCFSPVITMLASQFKILRGFLQTVHSYTSGQNLVDGPTDRDMRRGRAAAANIVPTTTEAIKAFEAALPDMAGLLMGMAMRVPVANGSNIDLVLQLDNETSREEINQHIADEINKSYKGIVEYSQDPLVSSDVVGNPHSCVVDSLLTECHGPLVRLFLWYDNEWGYTNRCAELFELVAGLD